MWERGARDCADLICQRLTKLYGGPATIQTLERKNMTHYLLIVSVQWNEKAEHRRFNIYLSPETAAVISAEMVPHDAN